MVISDAGAGAVDLDIRCQLSGVELSKLCDGCGSRPCENVDARLY